MQRESIVKYPLLRSIRAALFYAIVLMAIPGDVKNIQAYSEMPRGSAEYPVINCFFDSPGLTRQYSDRDLRSAARTQRYFEKINRDVPRSNVQNPPAHTHAQPAKTDRYDNGEPVSFFRQQYQHLTEEQLFDQYDQYCNAGFREYMSQRQGYKKHIEQCYQIVMDSGIKGYGRYFGTKVGGLFSGPTSPIHAAKYIKSMYLRLDELKIQEEPQCHNDYQIATAVAESTIILHPCTEYVQLDQCGDPEIIQQRVYHQCADAIEEEIVDTHLHDASNYCDEDYLQNEETIFALLQFMEQAGIDFDDFYDYEGDNDDQRALHAYMQSYLFENAIDAVCPTVVPDWHEEDFAKYLCQTIFQQGLAAAFDLNRADLSSQGRLLFDISQELFELGCCTIKHQIKVAQKITHAVLHPILYAQETVVGICTMISFAKKAAICTAYAAGHCVKGTSDLAFGAAYMIHEERTAFWKSWEALYGDVKHNIGCIKGSLQNADLGAMYQECNGENFLWALKTANSGVDFITNMTAQGAADIRIAREVSAIGSMVKPIALKCEVVRQGIQYYDGALDFAKTAGKTVAQPITNRVDRIKQWVNRRTREKEYTYAQLETGQIVEVPHSNCHLNEITDDLSTGGHPNPALTHPEQEIYTWDKPPHVDGNKPFPQEQGRCAKNEQKICINEQSPFKGCHDKKIKNNLKKMARMLDKYTYPIKLQTKCGRTLSLTRKDFEHIMQRHTLQYWNGTRKPPQSFFSVESCVEDVLKQMEMALKEMDITKIVEKGRRGQKSDCSVVLAGIKYTINSNGKNVSTFFANTVA